MKSWQSPRRMAAVGFGLLAALALGLGAWQWSAWRAESRQLVFTVPPGTAQRMAAGEEVSVLPGTIELDLSTHDTLVIRNDDSAAVTIGPFKIEPGQRFVQRYTNPGTFDMMCTLHSSQRVRVVVRR
ncbi:MAG: hypothetical protein RLZZ387_3484 [Chloroflexota bacterium]|jgi:plastocyanin